MDVRILLLSLLMVGWHFVGSEAWFVGSRAGTLVKSSTCQTDADCRESKKCIGYSAGLLCHWGNFLQLSSNECTWKNCAECTKDYHCNVRSECKKNKCVKMSDLIEDILKDGLRSGLELTIEQKAELFEIRRKMLQERSNMRFQQKELDAMTPRENNSSKVSEADVYESGSNILGPKLLEPRFPDYWNSENNRFNDEPYMIYDSAENENNHQDLAKHDNSYEELANNDKFDLDFAKNERFDQDLPRFEN